MIRDTRKLAHFEKEFLKKEKADFVKNLTIFESLHKEAIALGIYPALNPLEGLDTDIRIAKVLNLYND